MREISGGMPSPHWHGGYEILLPALCLLLAVILILFWRSRQPGMREQYMKLYGAGRGGGEIPSLSVYEAALLVRDIHRLALLLATSLVRKGALVVTGAPVPVMEKRDRPHEPLDADESEFLRLIDGKGRIDTSGLNAFVEALALRLAHRIWFSDKVLLRHFLEDKIDLIVEAAGERMISLTDSFWPLLHGTMDDWGRYAAALAPGSPPGGTDQSNVLPSLLYRELTVASLLPETLLDIMTATVKSREVQRHPYFPGELLPVLYGISDALSCFFSRYLGHFRHSVAEPYLQTLADVESSSAQVEKSSATARWREHWEERVQKLSALIKEKEEALVAHEDRVDYFQGPAGLNPALKEREESTKLKREILSREVFQLRAAHECQPSLLARGLNWKRLRAINSSLKEKEKALAAMTLELDSLRQEWEKERRETLRNDPSPVRQWRRLLIDLGRMRMEKGFVESHLEFLAARSAFHECQAGRLTAGTADGRGQLHRLMEESHKVIKAMKMLEKRLQDMEALAGLTPAPPLQEGVTGALLAHESRAGEILQSLRLCIDSFSCQEPGELQGHLEECQELLDRFNECFEPGHGRAAGGHDQQD